jgi:hypothetical protein
MSVLFWPRIDRPHRLRLAPHHVTGQFAGEQTVVADGEFVALDMIDAEMLGDRMVW